ncbi:MAG TPA: methyltransferase domain-containing protein [Chloroflexota bacterium]|nr:methyltransferase domain-containing protein [Chloroflexota bacterium]
MITQTANFERIRRLIQCQRLIRLAQNPTNVRYVKEACARIGLKAGDRVIDIGCGPAGALLPLAEVVGPSGMVVGLDRNDDVVNLARQVVTQRGLDQVKIVHADLDEFGEQHGYPDGSFDAAYCRLVLFNQRDPAAMLQRIAATVRPGGYVVAHEVLDDPDYPRFEPPVPGFSKFRHWFNECLRQQGRSPGVARMLSTLAEEAGLREISRQGLIDANLASAVDFIQEQGLNLLLVFKPSILLYGLATADEIEALAAEFRKATAVSYKFFLSWIMVEWIAQKPEQ